MRIKGRVLILVFICQDCQGQGRGRGWQLT